MAVFVRYPRFLKILTNLATTGHCCDVTHDHCNGSLAIVDFIRSWEAEARGLSWRLRGRCYIAPSLMRRRHMAMDLRQSWGTATRRPCCGLDAEIRD